METNDEKKVREDWFANLHAWLKDGAHEDPEWHIRLMELESGIQKLNDFRKQYHEVNESLVKIRNHRDSAQDALETITKNSPKYVAIITTCGQVGPDDWEMMTFTMRLSNETTIGQVKEWALNHNCSQNKITITNLE